MKKFDLLLYDHIGILKNEEDVECLPVRSFYSCFTKMAAWLDGMANTPAFLTLWEPRFLR